MLDAVQETETKMVEMSALNHLMSTHVLQQAQQIEYLYEQVSYISVDCKSFEHIIYVYKMRLVQDYGTQLKLIVGWFWF